MHALGLNCGSCLFVGRVCGRCGAAYEGPGPMIGGNGGGGGGGELRVGYE